MTVMNDPVGAGLVSSLAHPGNHTSVAASLNQDLTPKILEFVREIVPTARVLAAPFNPANPTSPVMMENLRTNGDRTGMTVLPLRWIRELTSMCCLLSSQPETWMRFR